MSDGSKEISAIENEIVHSHFARLGVQYCFFLGLQACKSADAEGIYDAIMAALKFDRFETSDFLNRMVAFAADGASVNTGELNGVIAIFRRVASESVVMIQCMGHRVELSFGDAFKKLFHRFETSGFFDRMVTFQPREPLLTLGN